MSNIRLIDDPKFTAALVAVFRQECPAWPWPPDWGGMLLNAPGYEYSLRAKETALARYARERSAGQTTRA